MIIEKILGSVVIILGALAVLFGVLSYHFYGSKAEAEQALVSAIDANTNLQKSLNLFQSSCTIGDKVSGEFVQEKAAKDKTTETVVQQIDKLPIKRNPDKALGDTHEATIDSKLPDDLIRLLQSHCDRTKGSSCSSP